jgi:hypothetical protein
MIFPLLRTLGHVLAVLYLAAMIIAVATAAPPVAQLTVTSAADRII